MIRRLSVVLAILLGISCVGVMGETMDMAGNVIGPCAEGVNGVVSGNTDFAFDLYAKLKDDKQVLKEGGNLFFSPYSISTALAMTWAGARGDTESQMAEVLHFGFGQEKLHPVFGSLEKYFNEAGQKGDYELTVANALWGQKGFKFLEEFLDLTKSSYGAVLNEVDFARKTENARKKINTWVEKKTNDKIKELIKKGILGRGTELVLTNAIYFKGDWVTKFDKKNTKKTDFTVSSDKRVETAMMYMKDKFKFFEDEDVKVIALPYKGDDLSMMVILPNHADGLGEIENQLTAGKVKKWDESLRKREVMLFLPKFKMTTGFGLGEILKGMGMTDAFDDRLADFSGMTGDKGLSISNVLHKAFVAVDEEGTEAAAATAVVIGRTSLGPVFRADHPFIFMIRDNQTGSILFIGRMMNPAITGE